MANHRIPGRRGLLWATCALLALLAVADLVRSDSVLRSWAGRLTGNERTPPERVLEEIRERSGGRLP